MRVPAFHAHRVARRADQARVRWLTEFVAVALMTIAMALAWFA